MSTCCSWSGCDESTCNELPCKKYCKLDKVCKKTNSIGMTRKCCECDYCGRADSSPQGKSHEYVPYTCGRETLCYKLLDKNSPYPKALCELSSSILSGTSLNFTVLDFILL